MNVQSILGSSSATLNGRVDATGAATGQGGFGRIVNEFMERVGRDEANADKAVQDLALGKTSDIHNIALTNAKADLNFRLLLEVRNRIQEVYQEVTRMQV